MEAAPGPCRGFHPRVVAPVEVRDRNLVEREDRTEGEAAREVERCDRERADFVRRVCGHSIDDPLGHDLVINQLSISLTAAAALEKFERLRAGPA